jgi:hypothetical protein
MSLSSREGGWGGLAGDGVPVGLAVPEHGEQDVDAAAGQTDQGGVVSLASSPFPVVVGATRRILQTGECRQEQGALESVVPALGSGCP